MGPLSLFRSSHLLTGAAIATSALAYTELRTRYGIKRRVSGEEDVPKTFLIVKKPASEHLTDYAGFILAGTFLFTAIRIGLSKCPVHANPLGKGPALTAAQQLTKKMGLERIRYYESSGVKWEEAAYDSPCHIISNPQLYLHSASSKGVIAHELIHIKRGHSLCKDLFTTSMLPTTMAFLEHFAHQDMVLNTSLISLLALRTLFYKYIEKEADLMACDLIEVEEIEEMIANFEEFKKIQPSKVPGLSLLDAHPDISTRIDYLKKEVQPRKTAQ